MILLDGSNDETEHDNDDERIGSNPTIPKRVGEIWDEVVVDETQLNDDEDEADDERRDVQEPSHVSACQDTAILRLQFEQKKGIVVSISINRQFVKKWTYKTNSVAKE